MNAFFSILCHYLTHVLFTDPYHRQRLLCTVYRVRFRCCNILFHITMSWLHEALYLLHVVDHRFWAKIFSDYAMIFFFLFYKTLLIRLLLLVFIFIILVFLCLIDWCWSITLQFNCCKYKTNNNRNRLSALKLAPIHNVPIYIFMIKVPWTIVFQLTKRIKWETGEKNNNS